MYQVIVRRQDGTIYVTYETNSWERAKEVAAEARTVSTTAVAFIRRKRPGE